MLANAFFITIQITLIASKEYLLAAQNVCYSTTYFVSDNTFNAPSNGIISGIKLVHKSGSVTCDKNLWAYNNWGCDIGIGEFKVEMIRISDSLPGFTYYPTSSTKNNSGLNYDACDKCGVLYYYMRSPISIFDDELILTDPYYPYSITTNNQFSIQYSEGCCDKSTGDNDGIACADVYFLYESPTTQPTHAPTTLSPITSNPTTPPNVPSPTESPTNPTSVIPSNNSNPSSTTNISPSSNINPSSTTNPNPSSTIDPNPNTDDDDDDDNDDDIDLFDYNNYNTIEYGIVGLVGVVFIAILICLIYCCCCKKSGKDDNKQFTTQSVQMYGP